MIGPSCILKAMSFVLVDVRFADEKRIVYFGENGWMEWQSSIDLRRPFRSADIYIRLFFTGFICAPKTKRVLIRHYFPSILIDVVEIDETVIEFAFNYFGIAKHKVI